jgi:hypothetical protein
MSELRATTGRCLCGDIQYEFTGAPDRLFHCHCDSCRRHVSSPVATFVCVLRETFRFTKGTPRTHISSPGVRRSVCPRCGSPIAYEADRIPNEVHLYQGTLSDPAAVRPTAHVHVAEQLDWFEVQDDLPRYAQGMRGVDPIGRGPRWLG